MTARELIQELEKLPGDTQVMHEFNGYPSSIRRVVPREISRVQNITFPDGTVSNSLASLFVRYRPQVWYDRYLDWSNPEKVVVLD